MATFCERFQSYYLSSTPHHFHAWEMRRTPFPSSEIPQRRVNIEESAERYSVSSRVKALLDQLITPEIHQRMAQGNIARGFYEARGFRVLKDNGTLVMEHQNLPGYLIKATTGERPFYYGTYPPTVQQVFVRHTNLLRPRGREYYMQQQQDPLFSLPQEFLYRTSHGVQGISQYYAISEKVEVFSEEESLRLVRALDPQDKLRVAQKVCEFIQRTGMVDMHPGNLLVKRNLNEWKFALIDQEPVGLFIEENDDPGSLMKKPECVIGGLIIFRDQYCRPHGFIEMADYVENCIQEYLRQHPQINVENHGWWVSQGNYRFDWLTVIRILLTIPFFYVVLPVLAMRAACFNRQAPLDYQLRG